MGPERKGPRQRIPGRQRVRYDDTGSATLYFVVMFVPLLFAVGLVYDGGRKVEGIGLARDLADNAARAGAQQVQTNTFRAGLGPPLDQVAAAEAVDEYLTGSGGSAIDIRFPQPDTIEVVVRVDVDFVLLPGGDALYETGSANTQQG